MRLGHIAQWIEHQVPVLGVGGSSPSMLVLKLCVKGFRLLKVDGTMEIVKLRLKFMRY
jgi:hypothetical protein